MANIFQLSFQSAQEDLISSVSISDIEEYFEIKGTYEINNNLIDVIGNVILIKETVRLPVNFGNVTGSFSCSNNQLTSLEGCPQSVGGSFSCEHNQLTSLQGCPQSVGGSFYCSYNQLTSLEGCPQSVGGYFFCYYNQLTNLNHNCEIGDIFFHD